jgi:general stress protein 26
MLRSLASDPMADLADHDIALLKGKNFAHFVTLNEDGSAHSAPLWIDVGDDGHVLVNSAVGRKKDRNIRRDPRVVVSVHAQDDP